jgi:hypothetical protein
MYSRESQRDQKLLVNTENMLIWNPGRLYVEGYDIEAFNILGDSTKHVTTSTTELWLVAR